LKRLRRSPTTIAKDTARVTNEVERKTFKGINKKRLRRSQTTIATGTTRGTNEVKKEEP
jgi:hypothetical protein